jgi:KaiC/GvpD/RAD55 family RecA-like ATPase
MLFSELWHEGEICILFASAGAGKSVLAVQIGNSISEGNKIPGFKNESEKQAVLYCDFELSDKQFEIRYSEKDDKEYKNAFVFSENFIRLELNPDAEKPEEQTVEEFLITSIERRLLETGAKILIVDNLTYLRNDTEKARDALPLMKQLKALKKAYALSLLVLAHTPKRDASKPITKNDLSGSVMLINFCDSSFAIGFSNQDPNIRYIKQIKERFTPKLWGDDNVIICQMEKEVNFLEFIFMDFGKEADHLRSVTEETKQVIEEMIMQRHLEGKSYRDIGRELKMSHMKVKRCIQKNDEKLSK